MSSEVYGFSPNFTASHTVVLDHPIDQVFTIIGTDKGHERVCRLSSLCTSFELLEKENICLAADASLSGSTARLLPATTSDTGLVVPRQRFRMTETISTFMIKSNVHIEGTLTWDTEKKLALYETTVPASGITVWKLRQFEEIDGGKTRVTETIHGHSPALLRRFVQSETSKGHKAHMELYPTLF